MCVKKMQYFKKGHREGGWGVGLQGYCKGKAKEAYVFISLYGFSLNCTPSKLPHLISRAIRASGKLYLPIHIHFM